MIDEDNFDEWVDELAQELRRILDSGESGMIAVNLDEYPSRVEIYQVKKLERQIDMGLTHCKAPPPVIKRGGNHIGESK